MQRSSPPGKPVDEPVDLVSAASNLFSSNMSVNSAVSSRYVRPSSMSPSRRPPPLPLAGPTVDSTRSPPTPLDSPNAQGRSPDTQPRRQFQLARLHTTATAASAPAALAAAQLSSVHAGSFSESCSALFPSSPPAGVAAAGRPAVDAAAHPSPQFWLVDVKDDWRDSQGEHGPRRSPTHATSFPLPPTPSPVEGDAARAAGSCASRRELPLQLSPWPPAAASNSAGSMLSHLNGSSNTSADFSRRTPPRQPIGQPPLAASQRQRHAPLASVFGMSGGSEPARCSPRSPGANAPRRDGALHEGASSRGSDSLVSSRLRSLNGSSTFATSSARVALPPRLLEPSSDLAAAILAAAESPPSARHLLASSHMMHVPGHATLQLSASAASYERSPPLSATPRQLTRLHGLDGVGDLEALYVHAGHGSDGGAGGRAREEAEAAADAVQTLALSSSDSQDDGDGGAARLHATVPHVATRDLRSPITTTVAVLSAEHHHPHQPTDPRPRAFWRLKRSLSHPPVTAAESDALGTAQRAEVSVAAGAAHDGAASPTAAPLPASSAGTRDDGHGDAPPPSTAPPPPPPHAANAPASAHWSPQRPPAQLWYAPPPDSFAGGAARGGRLLRPASALGTLLNSEASGGRGGAVGLIGDDAEDDAPSRVGTAAALPLDQRHYDAWLRRQYPHCYRVWRRARLLRIVTIAAHGFLLMYGIMALIVLYVRLGHSSNVFLILDVNNRLTRAVQHIHTIMWLVTALVLWFGLSFPLLYVLRKVWLDRRLSAAARAGSGDTLATMPHVVQGMESAVEMSAILPGGTTVAETAETAAAAPAGTSTAPAPQMRGAAAGRLGSIKSWLLPRPSLSARSRPADSSDAAPSITAALSDTGHGGCTSSSLSGDGGSRLKSPRGTSARTQSSSGPRGDAPNPLAYAAVPEQRQLGTAAADISGGGDRPTRATPHSAPTPSLTPPVGLAPRGQLRRGRSELARTDGVACHAHAEDGTATPEAPQPQPPHAATDASPRPREAVAAVSSLEAPHAEDEHRTSPHPSCSSSHPPSHHHHYSLVEVMPVSPRSPPRLLPLHPHATPDLASHNTSSGCYDGCPTAAVNSSVQPRRGSPVGGGAPLPLHSVELLDVSKHRSRRGCCGGVHDLASCCRACGNAAPSYVTVKFVLRGLYALFVLAVLITSSSLCARGLVTTEITTAQPENWGHWLAMSHSGQTSVNVQYGVTSGSAGGSGNPSGGLNSTLLRMPEETAAAARYRLCVKVELSSRCSGFSSNCTAFFESAEAAYTAGCPLCPPAVQAQINAVAGNVTCSERFESVKEKYHVAFYVVFVCSTVCSLASLLLVMLSHTHLAWQHLEWNPGFWRG